MFFYNPWDTQMRVKCFLAKRYTDHLSSSGYSGKTCRELHESAIRAGCMDCELTDLGPVVPGQRYGRSSSASSPIRLWHCTTAIGDGS